MSGEISRESKVSENSLVLEYIDLENFKSYAYKHRIGPFNSTFTAVIGPNGSGKSNILDALLFVFGKRATKIRLERLSELIHSSAGSPTFNHASVTVVFYEPSTGRRIELSRVVYRHNNSTQYLIDEKKHSHSSVINFLKEKGVDLEHNRFLILQGEVEQIALMRPKAEREGEEGFLEYLDDLIGTNRYVARISELLNQTENLQESRMAVLEHTHKLGKDRELLEHGKNAAMSLVKKDNQMHKMVSIMCQLKIQRAESEVAPFREALKKSELRLQEAKIYARNVQSAIENHEKHIQEVNAHIGQVDADIRKLLTDKETFEDQTQEAKSTIEMCEKDEKKQYESQKKLKDEILKITNQIEDYDRDKRISSENRQEVESRLDKSQPELDKMRETISLQTKPLQNERERLLRTLAPFKAMVDEKTVMIDEFQQRIESLEKDATKKESELTDLRERKTSSEVSLKQQQHVLKTVECKLQELETSSSESTSDYERSYQNARDRRIALSQQIDSLKRQLQNSAGDDRVTQFLESQMIRGYYGPLRKLCSIDEKYDIAAGVAGGGLWAYHVVEDENIAQQCIALLKKHNAGRGSFIVLSFQRKTFSEKSLTRINTPAQTFRLFDQLRFVDLQYRYAAYFAVRDTLIADSLSTARRVGLDKSSRYRIVTPAGELVEPSGQITGGGQRKPQGARLQGGTADSSGRSLRNELQSLTAELEKLELDEREAKHRIVSQRDADSNRSHHKRELQIQYQQTKAAMQKENDTLEQMNVEISEVMKLLKVAHSKLQGNEYAGMQRSLEKLTQDRKNVQIQSQEHSTKLQDVETQIADFGGPAYTNLQLSVDNDRKWLHEQKTKNHQILKGEARLKSVLETKKNELKDYGSQAKESNMERMRDSRQKIDDIAALIKEVSISIDQKRSVTMDFQESKRKIGEKIQAAKSELLSIEESQQTLSQEINEINGQIDEKRSNVLKYEERIEASEKQIYENVLEYGGETVAFKDDGEDERNETYIEDHQDHDIRRFNTTVPKDILGCQDFQRVKYFAEELKAEIDRLKEVTDLASIARWKEKDQQWKDSKAKYDLIHEQTIEAEDSLARARDQRQREFLDAFGNIRLRLKSLYQILTQGGDADLELVDAHDPFQGINFCVRPPKKSWKQIGQLSGGEKTLASLSFIFALHHYRPTPIYIMDEIDAALDFRNVSIVAQYVSTQAIGAQFIIISLRNSMFEMANQLIGVSKVKDRTTSITMSPALIKQNVEEQFTLSKSKALEQE